MCLGVLGYIRYQDVSSCMCYDLEHMVVKQEDRIP